METLSWIDVMFGAGSFFLIIGAIAMIEGAGKRNKKERLGLRERKGVLRKYS